MGGTRLFDLPLRVCMCMCVDRLSPGIPSFVRDHERKSCTFLEVNCRAKWPMPRPLCSLPCRVGVGGLEELGRAEMQMQI